MANLLVHRTLSNLPYLKLGGNYYWDLWLSRDSPTYTKKYPLKLWDGCLISSFDFNDNTCLDDNGKTIYSLKKYFWSEGKNDGVYLKDIGFCELDNGFIDYNPETDDFMTLFTKSTYTINEGDMRVFLNPIKGYYHNFNYEATVKEESSGAKYLSLNGGFYQGWTKLDGFNYQVSPIKPEREFAWEFILRPKNENVENTINEKYPNNKGLFFYMGTRAENKWWYCANNGVLTFREDDDQKYVSDYFLDDYLDMNVVGDEVGDTQNDYCSLSTSSGVPLNKPNVVRIKTDNKYLFFNRGGDGYTTCDFGDCCYNPYDNRGGGSSSFDDDDHYVEYQKKNSKINYYLLFNRGQNGYTTCDFGDCCYNPYDNGTTKPSPEVDLYDDTINITKDLYYNGMGFRITDDGKIGYRYIVRNCSVTDVNPNDYKIAEEYSKSGMVNMNKWNHVVVRFITNQYLNKPECENRQRMGRLYFYINGKLKFISNEFLEPNFRSLDEYYEKQECVPYNISLGGGSQGLMDFMISPDPEEYIRYVFPIEENFAGSMIGDIMVFNMYNCQYDYTKIANNYAFYQNYLKKFYIYI